MRITENTTVQEVLDVFKDNGRLLFPIDRPISNHMTLKELSSSQVYLWYSYIDVYKTIEVIETLKKQTSSIFYPIYTEEEMLKDPSKRNTGLYFFKGKEYAPYAICNAGGGFMYVGAMHDSFPHAIEI